MYTESRQTELALLKRLWAGQATLCPRCNGAELVRLHRRGKKGKANNNDWQCPACGEVLRTINLFCALPPD